MLLRLLCYESTSVFIDGTFRSAPCGYKQCVVVMVHDAATSVFVPVFYVVSTAKAAEAYWDILHCIFQATDQKLKPSEVVCDFEAALINAIEVQLPNSLIIGCLFHYKQAIMRALKRHCIPKAEMKISLKRGVLDALTVIPIDEISGRGIAWVKGEIKRLCSNANIPYSRTKWQKFWRYFRSTWLKTFEPDYWNVHGLDSVLVARTNNPLERFNRELNKAFPTPRPTMTQFVSTIKKISKRYVGNLHSIAMGRMDKPNHDKIILPLAPSLVAVTDGSDSDESSSDSSDGDEAEGVGSDGDDTGSELDADMSFDYEGPDSY